MNRRRFLKAFLMAGVSTGLGACGAAGDRATPVAGEQVGQAGPAAQSPPGPETLEAAPATPTPEATSPSPTEETHSMIWYVDIEHEDALADPLRAPDFESVRYQRAQICGRAAGVDCEPVLYQQVSRELAGEHHLSAMAISGNTTDWAEYDFATFEPLFELIRSGDFAVLALCGGHQLIGLMYGARCDAIRKLRPGEEEKGNFAPGWFKEVGYLPVHVIKQDPIFDSLGSDPVFFESHYWEIKELPPEFELLASTEECPVQAMKHKDHLIYGTQFHPEVNSAEHRDGFRLLRNFFTLAGVWKT
jgi:GMP synthase-like glutamine amidotransferase